MIRDILSQLISDVANQVMPYAVGDEWRSENFTVLFQPQRWEQAVNVHYDDYWDAVAQLSGTALVRVYTDEKRPLDLTPLMIALFSPPIPCVFVPSPAEFSEGEYTVRLHWNPTELTDMMYESGIVPVISGSLEKCYVLRRNDIVHPLTTPNTARIAMNFVPADIWANSP